VTAEAAAVTANASGWKEGMQNWKTVGVKLRLNRIGFKLAQEGKRGKVEELVKFEMNDIGTDIDIQANGGMYVTAYLHEIILEDVRVSSENIHRRLIAPTTTSSSEHQLVLRFEACPATSEKVAISLVSVNMFAPRFVLLSDVFSDLYGFTMRLLGQVQKGLTKYNKLTQKPETPFEEPSLALQEEAAPPAPPVDMKVEIMLKSPEIIAMEDTTSPGDLFFLLFAVFPPSNFFSAS
jgi:hypothetical protein